jgi:thioredoxin 1
MTVAHRETPAPIAVRKESTRRRRRFTSGSRNASGIQIGQSTSAMPKNAATASPCSELPVTLPIVSQTNPSEVCCSANSSGTPTNIACEAGLARARETAPTPASNAATPKLPVAEKHNADNIGLEISRTSLALLVSVAYDSQAGGTMATVELTGENFKQHVEKPGILIIDWWAPWCGPCRTFGPIYDKASDRHTDAVFGKINTEAQPELAGMFGIQSIPTLMVFRDQVLVFARPGLVPGEVLDDLLGKVKALDMDDVRKQIAASDVEAAEDPGKQPQ